MVPKPNRSLAVCKESAQDIRTTHDVPGPAEQNNSVWCATAWTPPFVSSGATGDNCVNPVLGKTHSQQKVKSKNKIPRLVPLTPAVDSVLGQQVANSAAKLESYAEVVSACTSNLTTDSVDSSCDALAAFDIEAPQFMEVLVHAIFEQAKVQHHLIPTYADFCVRLCLRLTLTSEHSFRQCLLDACSLTFQQIFEPYSNLRKAGKIDEKLQLASVKFIGYLLVHKLVTPKLVVEFAEKSLICHCACSDVDEQLAQIFKGTSCACALELLAALLMVTGKLFDHSSWLIHPQLLDVFTQMQQLSKDKAVPVHARLLLSDVLDAREAGWSLSTQWAGSRECLDERQEHKLLASKTSKKSTPESTKMIKPEMSKSQNSVEPEISQSRESAKMMKQESVKDTSSAQSDAKQSHHMTHIENTAAETIQMATTTDSPVSNPRSRHPQDGMDRRASITVPFDAISFHRAVTSILADLASDRRLPTAVRRMRQQRVPVEYQANEFRDLLTRIVEENRGCVRRIFIAFAAGLGASDTSAFDRKACLDGIAQFFEDVYVDLRAEIPRLQSIVLTEVLPTFCYVFSETDIDCALPSDLGFQLSDKWIAGNSECFNESHCTPEKNSRPQAHPRCN